VWATCQHSEGTGPKQANFFAWHRMYLYYFERIVRAQVVALGGPSDWALPYWDYDAGERANRLPRAFRHRLRRDGSANPLYVAERAPGINSGAGLPAEITSPAFALSRTAFTGVGEFGGGVTSPLGQFWSETGRLEQTPHNDVHVAVGGLMSDPDTAATDPIFWLHHANIDRLWRLWQDGHTNAKRRAWRGQSFDFFDVGGVAVSVSASRVLQTIKQLGYAYEQPAGAAPPAASLRGGEARVNATWPGSWPTRPQGEPPAATDVAPRRELVGATDEPVELAGEPLTVSVPVDQRTVESLRSSPAAPPQQRAYLDLEDIEAERNPGTVYGVYVGLPENPTAEDLTLHHVGNLSLFGVERARNPRGDVHAHGLRVSMEITDVLDRLAESGSWSDGGRIEATFRPLALQPPTDAEEAEGGDEAADQAAGGQEPSPVRVGRVSVHFA
jgi:tyrosinase-like protein